MSEPILVLTGPSGAGKTTLCRYIVDKYGFTQPRTYTTRKPRGEDDYTSYIFVERNEFEKKIANNELIEYVESFGNYYGSPTDAFHSNQKVTLAMNGRGAKVIQKLYPDRVTIIKLKITPDVMLQRMKLRQGICGDQLVMRMKEVDHDSIYDHLIDSNQQLDSVYTEVDSIITTLKSPA